MSRGSQKQAPILNDQEPVPQPASVLEALRAHWRKYCEEAIELGVFMFAACGFTLLLFHPDSAVVHLISSARLRRALLGLAMGLTAIGIMQSPFGRSSGAHFNPAVTLAFFWLGKVSKYDTIFYIAAQFVGGLAGVLAAAALFGDALAHPAIKYAVTVPGHFGIAAAFVAEASMAFLLMAVVLRVSNHKILYRYTPLFAGALIAMYVFVFAPVSGFSINPARTVSSGLVAGIWTSVWLYFCAPILGMIAAAEQYARSRGLEKVFCAKLQHHNGRPCHFRCRFPQLLASE